MEQNYTGEYSSHDMEVALRATSAAKRAFSTIALAAGLYTVVSFVAVLLISLIINFSGITALPFVQQHAAELNILLSTLPMYLIGVPVFYLIIRRLPTFPLPGGRLTVSAAVCIFLVSRFFIFIGSNISTWLTDLFYGILGYELTDTTTELITETPIWLIILVVVVIGPIIEELIYRKLMIDRLAAFGDVPAILFSSVLFGIGHGNFFQFAYAALLGAVFGYLYTSTGKLRYPIILHMLTNFLGSVAVLPLMDIATSVQEQLTAVGGDVEALLMSEQAAEFIPGLLLLLAYNAIEYGLMIAGLILFCIYVKRVKTEPRLLAKVGRGPMLRSACLNVGVAVFAVVSVLQFLLSMLPA